MAVSVSTGTTKGRSQFVLGNRRAAIIEVTFDSSYPTGGETLDLEPYIQGPVAAVFCDVKATNASDDVQGARYDRTNSKIVLVDFDSEIADTTDISDTVVVLFIIGE